MNEKTKKVLVDTMYSIGIISLAVNFVADLFFGGFDKLAHSQLGIAGIALILSASLLRRWKRDKSLTTKTMIILDFLLLVAALIITLFGIHDPSIIGIGEGIMLVAIAIYMILFFWTQYQGE